MPQHRGRGTSLNPGNRFESIEVDWDEELSDASALQDQPPPRTQYIRDDTQSALTKNNSPDLGFNYSLNPYRGCEHGCVYCYARRFHEYLGYSAGLDFETKILVKHDLPRLLRGELMRRSWQPQMIAMSGVTDPYQPVERRLRISRACLEVLAEFRNPVGIVTKSALVARDADLLQGLARYDAAGVLFSITTLDPDLHRRMEPRAATGEARLEAMRRLVDAGVPCGVMIGPIVPGLNDTEIPQIVRRAADAGASSAHYTLARLAGAIQPIFADWLGRHYPNKREMVLRRIRSLHDGAYTSDFRARQEGFGEEAERIRFLMSSACQKAGLSESRPNPSAAAFRRPSKQRELFDRP